MELLKEFKEKEDHSQLAVMSRPYVETVVSSWRFIDKNWTPPEASSETANKRWIEIWEGVDFNMADLAKTINVSLEDAKSAFEVAVRNRLIYPDGTVHQAALQLIRATIASNIKNRSK